MESRGERASEKVIGSLEEVTGMDIGDAAKAVELAERVESVRHAMAWRALDIATNPDTPQGKATEAMQLYNSIGVNVIGTVETSNHPAGVEVEIYRERAVQEAIRALSEKYGQPPERFGCIPGTNVVALLDGRSLLLGKNDSPLSVRGIWARQPEEHTVMIAGAPCDDRLGMTLHVYRALVKNVEDRRVYRAIPDYMPHNLNLRNRRPKGPFSMTVMTGLYDRNSEKSAPVAYTDTGSRVMIKRTEVLPDDAFPGIGFRPAVILPDLKKVA